MEATAARLFNETNRLGQALWAKSVGTAGLNSDPKTVSILLFKRLWSHHRGYALLYNDNLGVEADTLLRSSIEASICMAANYHTPGGLWLPLRQDALHTVQGQVKQFRESDDTEMVRDSEAMCRWLQKGLPGDLKGKRLDMKDLAADGKVPVLYGLYRQLSGISSHVSGLSIMRGVVTDADPSLQDQWAKLNREVHPLFQITATLQGCFVHALLLEEDGLLETCVDLLPKVSICLDARGYGD